jgi:hypothetical protein
MPESAAVTFRVDLAPGRVGRDVHERGVQQIAVAVGCRGQARQELVQAATGKPESVL